MLGAIYSLVTILCVLKPSLSLYFILLPMVPIPITVATPVALSLDVVGLARNWAFFDHAGHLGGALAGVVYAYTVYPTLKQRWVQKRRNFFWL